MADLTYAIRLELDERGYLRAVDAATGETRQLDDAVLKLQSDSKKTGKAGAEGFRAFRASAAKVLAVLAAVAIALSVVRSGASLVGTTINEAAKFETATSQLQTFVGSLDGAKAKIHELQIFAARTPFELPGILEATRKLLAFGGQALAQEKNLRRVGDAASAIGQPLEEIAFWFGRAYSAIKAGAPIGEVVMRLRELGIANEDTVRQVEKLRKAGASSSEVWELFASQFDRFAGSMSRQSATFEGRVSTLRDTWQQFLRTVGGGSDGESGPLNVAKTAVIKLTEAVEKLEEVAGDDIALFLSKTLKFAGVAAVRTAQAALVTFDVIIQGAAKVDRAFTALGGGLKTLNLIIAEANYKAVERELELLGEAIESGAVEKGTDALYARIKGLTGRLFELSDEIKILRSGLLASHKDYELSGKAAEFLDNKIKGIFLSLEDLISGQDRVKKKTGEVAAGMVAAGGSTGLFNTALFNLNKQAITGFQVFQELFKTYATAPDKVKALTAALTTGKITLEQYALGLFLVRKEAGDLLGKDFEAIASTVRTQTEAINLQITSLLDNWQEFLTEGGVPESALEETLERLKLKLLEVNQTMTDAQKLNQEIAGSFASSFADAAVGLQDLSSLSENLVGQIQRAFSNYISSQIQGLFQADAAKDAIHAKDIARSAQATAANTTEAGSGFFKAHSAIPWVGLALAIGFILSMQQQMKKLKAQSRQAYTGYASGGIVPSRQFILAGERGPEIVAPLKDFKEEVNDMRESGEIGGGGGGVTFIENNNAITFKDQRQLESTIERVMRRIRFRRSR